MRLVVVAFAMMGLFGCSTPRPDTVTPPANSLSPSSPKVATSRGELPEYEVADVITGGLISLGPNDEVIYIASDRPYEANLNTRINKNPFDGTPTEHRGAQSGLFLKAQGQTKSVPQDSFLDEKGVVRVLPSSRPIREVINGKSYDLEPLQCPTTAQRYYQSAGNLFWRNSNQREIRRLYSASNLGALIFRQGRLAVSSMDASGASSISIFDTSGHLASHFENTQGVFLDFCDGDFALLQDSTGGTIIDHYRRERLVGGMPLGLVRIGDHPMAIGAYCSDRSTASWDLCAWNSEGTIVPFSLLCPRIPNIFAGRRIEVSFASIRYNQRGTLAIQVVSMATVPNDKEFNRSQIILLHPKK